MNDQSNLCCSGYFYLENIANPTANSLTKTNQSAKIILVFWKGARIMKTCVVIYEIVVRLAPDTLTR